MKKTMIALTLSCLAVLGSTASAVQLFDFDGQAIWPAAPGGTAVAYGRIVNGEAVEAPLPFDFANFEYTLAVTDLVLDSAGSTSYFSGGIVTIYKDDATPADFAAPATFTDGEAVLSGVMATFQHVMLTGTLGSANGYVDWTGGSMLNDLAPSDQLGWPFLTLVSRSATQVQPGYTEKWDGKIEPVEEVVASEVETWSGVKALFR